MGKILGTDNPADLFTKVVVGQLRANLLTQVFLHPPGSGNFGTDPGDEPKETT